MSVNMLKYTNIFMMQKQEESTTLPGVFATLAAGFDLTAKHLWLLILPILLDVFYWLGPRLSYQKLIERVVTFWLEQPEFAEIAEIMQFTTLLRDIAPRTNLFTMLTVPLVGVPALMTGGAPETTPIIPGVQQIEDWGAWLGLFLVFLVVGLLLTAVYFTTITYALKTQNGDEILIGFNAWAQRVGKYWLRLMGLAFVFILNLFIIYIPLVLVATIFYIISPALGSLVVLAGPFLAMWIILFISFAPFGIVMNGRSVWRSMVESFRLVQTYLVPTLTLFLMIFLIGTLLDWLLILVENGTWLALLNILGHAFISTALVAAMFIFYRDRYIALFVEIN